MPFDNWTKAVTQSLWLVGVQTGRLLDDSPTGPFPDMFNELISQGLAKNLNRATFDAESLSCSLVLQPVPSCCWVWVVILKSGKDRSLLCWPRRCRVGVQRFPLTLIVPSQPLYELNWMLKLRMTPESAWIGVDYNAFVENFKYCWFVWLIICQEKVLLGSVLSGKRTVRETSGYRLVCCVVASDYMLHENKWTLFDAYFVLTCILGTVVCDLARYKLVYQWIVQYCSKLSFQANVSELFVGVTMTWTVVAC